jgi:hypothetical protein
VRRRWVPRLGAESFWRRFRRRFRRTMRRPDVAEIPGIDSSEGIAIALVVVVGVVLLFLLVVPLLVALVDLLILLLLALVGGLARIAFRRPWVIEARADDGTTQVWRVRGWRASGARRDQIASLLRAGATPHGESGAGCS